MRVREDTGSATLWSLVLITVLLTAGCLAMAVAQVAPARQRLSSAADLTVLAAAQQPSQGCARAAHIAQANGVDLTACWFDGVDHWVEVRLPPPTLLVRIAAVVGARADDLRVTSRAGPDLPPAMP